MKAGEILSQMKKHAPFTAAGTASGLLIMAILAASGVSRDLSEKLFWTLHPLHVLVSAQVTAAMYRRRGRRNPLLVLLVGYVGSVGIATLSDSLIPFAGEWLLGLPGRDIHLGFNEKRHSVHPLAAAGVVLARYLPATRVPHGVHVFLSTWASLFHMTMAMTGPVATASAVLVAGFLFLAVWVPCCTSDIVFPLLWTGKK